MVSSLKSQRDIPDRESEIGELHELIANLEAMLADLKARMPAHSTPPALIAQLDEIDEELSQARVRLNRFVASDPDGERTSP